MEKEFSKSRKGYDKAEVDAYVKENDNVNASLRAHIADLTKKLEETQGQLSNLKQKQDLIVRSIMGAVQKSEQIEALTKQKYEFDMAQLKSFHERWLDYYNKLIAKFPLDSQLKGLNNFNRNMFRLLNTSESLDNKVMNKIDKEISQADAQFLRESARLTQNAPSNNGNLSGLSNLSSLSNDDGEDDDGMDGIPVFNPEETIRSLIRRQLDEESGKKRRKTKEKTAEPDESEAVFDEGFSYEEALNPKQELSEILKELGLDLN